MDVEVPPRVKRIRPPSGEIVFPPPASTCFSVDVAHSNIQEPFPLAWRSTQLPSGAN